MPPEFTGGHGRPPRGQRGQRGQCPRTDFGAIRKSSPLRTPPGPLKLPSHDPRAHCSEARSSGKTSRHAAADARQKGANPKAPAPRSAGEAGSNCVIQDSHGDPLASCSGGHGAQRGHPPDLGPRKASTDLPLGLTGRFQTRAFAAWRLAPKWGQPQYQLKCTRAHSKSSAQRRRNRA